jgi:hypothetical protein
MTRKKQNAEKKDAVTLDVASQSVLPAPAEKPKKRPPKKTLADRPSALPKPANNPEDADGEALVFELCQAVELGRAPALGSTRRAGRSAPTNARPGRRSCRRGVAFPEEDGRPAAEDCRGTGDRRGCRDAACGLVVDPHSARSRFHAVQQEPRAHPRNMGGMGARSSRATRRPNGGGRTRAAEDARRQVGRENIDAFPA